MPKICSRVSDRLTSWTSSSSAFGAEDGAAGNPGGQGMCRQLTLPLVKERNLKLHERQRYQNKKHKRLGVQIPLMRRMFLGVCLRVSRKNSNSLHLLSLLVYPGTKEREQRERKILDHFNGEITYKV
jgi:hypothetical protein